MLETPKARQQRQSFHKLAPQEIAALLAMSKAVEASGLERGLLELVKLRSSQLNGCAFLLQMHATDARKMGMSEEKMQLLAAFGARRRSILVARAGCAGLDREFDAGGYVTTAFLTKSTTMPYRSSPTRSSPTLPRRSC